MSDSTGCPLVYVEQSWGLEELRGEGYGLSHTGTALRSSQNWNPALTDEWEVGVVTLAGGHRWNQAGQRSGQAWWHLSGLAVRQPAALGAMGLSPRTREMPTGVPHYTDRPGKGRPWKGSI